MKDQDIDEILLRNASLEQGREEGKTEGKAEERAEIVRKMHAKGMSIKDITEITGLTEPELGSIIAADNISAPV